VYPNLLADCGWRALTGADQAWMSDITYIRLPEGFGYLATILDGYTRRVVGWCLTEELVAETALAALRMALGLRQPPPGWIHHSDRGVQYACQAYVQYVEAAGGRISMAGKGNPLQNAQAESFVRTLKQEEVYLREYADFAAARRSIGRFIEDVYNEKRLHSALGYRPPTEFEQLIAAGIILAIPAHRRVESKTMANGRGNGPVATEHAEAIVAKGMPRAMV
jgi:transposase InsO family protein